MTTAATAISTHRDPELLGQTVIVIGGSGGIGLETARRARAEGASVILTGRNSERLKQAALELDAQRTELSAASETWLAWPAGAPRRPRRAGGARGLV